MSTQVPMHCKPDVGVFLFEMDEELCPDREIGRINGSH